MRILKSLDEHYNKASELWNSFDPNERFGVRWGIFPYSKMPEETDDWDVSLIHTALMTIAAVVQKADAA